MRRPPISKMRKQLCGSPDVGGRVDIPAFSLPPELVSEIFLHCLPRHPDLPPVTGLESPFTLSHICRKWREIALSTPALWRGISVTLDGCRGGRRELDLLKTYLSRSGCMPLSIRLNCGALADVHGREDASPFAAPFVNAIALRSDRLEHLSLCLPIRSLPALPGPLPSLKSLTLACYEPGAQDAEACLTRSFLSAPLLRRVTLSERYREMYKPILPWSQLTALVVDLTTLAECTMFLGMAPNLIYCRLTVLVRHAPVGAVTLPHLQTLCLNVQAPKFAPTGLGDFITSLTLPALTRLQISSFFLFPASSPTTLITNLVSRSRCNLEELWIHDAPTSSGAEAQWRAALPSLSSVVLGKRDRQFGKIWDGEGAD
ncbi:hypothetical protein FB45DRAFT_387299 [Roridomyces roridus]|uniref:F-box domain-containing protein n=1 Tax=Roridomyces roridus TaxID=1738132 RepID=A0AAD7B2V5_9AGAR|nr:hypothetical protein FB45DRAFT_387299 [Roridomyces roridus]